jgi:hypothetical protein
MAAFDDLLKGNLGTGLAVGIGVAVIGPLIAPVIAGVLRPAAKTLVKGGIYAYDRAHEALAQLNDAAGDVLAEARSEASQKPPPSGRQKSAGAQAASGN